MRGKKAKAIRREARKVALSPTMWRRVPQQHRIGRKLDAQVIVSPGCFRDCVKRIKQEIGHG